MMNLKNQIWTIPNLLTLMRLMFLIPIMYYLVHQLAGWVLFWGLLGIATDFIDGWIARKLKQTSDLGRFMDPVVDKINVIAVTFYMSISPDYHFPLWYFLFIIIRECMVMLGGLIVARKKKIVLQSNRAGKWSAFITGFMIIFFIIDIQEVQIYAWIMVLISFVLTLFSTVQYTSIFIHTMKSESNLTRG